MAAVATSGSVSLSRRLGQVLRRRLIQVIPTIFGVTLVTFLLVRLLPGGPVQTLVGVRATPATIAAVTRQLGLSRPIVVQYFSYLGQLAHGNLGYSFLTGTSVSSIVATHMVVTLELISLAVLLALLAGIPLATIAAYRRDGWEDQLIRAGTVAIMPSHLRVPELTGDLPATVSAAALGGLLRGELGFTGVIVSDALEMRATRDMFGIPQAAVLAVAAGTDLLCLGRDGSQDEYLAVRAALVAAVRDGTLEGTRLEEAADRVARLRGGLARARRQHDGLLGGAVRGGALVAMAADGVGIGLAAARRALRVSGPRRMLSQPVIIEIEPRENIAAGRFGWGLGPWAPPGRVRRVSMLGDDGVASDAAEILAAAAGRSLAVVVRDAHRDQNTRSLVNALLATRPDLVLVEMGLPLWRPPEGTSYLATYGASRASAHAAAELLGLT